jgi:hypothetical protein
MSRANVTDEAFDELAIVAKLHAPLIIDQNVAEDDGKFKSTRRPPRTSSPERGGLCVDTQLSASVAAARGGHSPTLTSESDRDDIRSRRAVRPVASLPSFHLPHRARHSWYRDRGTETPDLTSTSRSSLTSSISRNSGLYTPPHSPPISSFIHAEISNPVSHLSAISELQNTTATTTTTDENAFHDLFRQQHPLEVKSTQTIMKKTERSRSPSVMRSESGGQEQQQQHHPARAVPDGLDHAHVHRSGSATSTVTNLLLSAKPRSSSTITTAAAASSSSFTQFPKSVSAYLPDRLSPSPSPSPANRAGRAWSFGGKSSSRWSVVAPGFGKVEKKDERKRKKEEARARKEQRLAEELKKRGETQKLNGVREWEEDIAVYGSLASM